MRRATEDGAGAVVHQHEVGDIDRQLPRRVERVGDGEAGIVAALFRRLDRRRRRAAAPALGDEVGQIRVALGGGQRYRMIGGDRQKLGAEQRVRPGRIDLDLSGAERVGGKRETDHLAFRPADPVALHHLDLLGPAIERVEAGQQVFREQADAEEPLRQFALLDERAGAPAAAVDHLLVGEHGVVDGIPVHLGLLAVDKALGEEVEEQALLMLVIAGVAGRDLARPVERQAHGLQLRPHRCDVLISPGRGVAGIVARGVLRRHAEGVPPHRMQHVEALGPLVARHHVAHRVVAHMAHVDAAAGIGKHLQHVIFGAGAAIAGAKNPALVPDFLPLGLGLAGVVAFGGHDAFGELTRLSLCRRRQHEFGLGANLTEHSANSRKRLNGHLPAAKAHVTVKYGQEV